jgi:hypothetical protein
MCGRRAYLSIAGVLAVAAIAASGCGEDDPAPVVPVEGASGASGAAGAGALSKSSFVKQADAICREANSALTSLDSATVDLDPKVQASQQLQITSNELDSLQSLTPPSQDRSTLNDFLDSLQDEINALMSKRDAAEQGGDTSTAEAEAANARASAAAAADDYGLKVCSKGTQSSIATQGTTTTPTTVPTTTTPTTPAPTTPTPPPAPPAPPPAPAPPSGGTGGGTPGGGTGGGSGGSGGVSP